jgi:hypothetical protein|tara:strand:- start:250 stop:504 length:255 start_codon:yes stop_codon:yes gene_type:complete
MKSSKACVLIFDDSIAAKPYSDENEIVCYHWDHAKKSHIKGINFLSCLFEKDGVRLPIAAEIIEKKRIFHLSKNSKSQTPFLSY